MSFAEFWGLNESELKIKELRRKYSWVGGLLLVTPFLLWTLSLIKWSGKK